MKSGSLSFFLAALVALVAALTQARAAPLDAETCTKLQSEHAALELAGVETDMAKGPDWARANLGLERIQRVQRYIEVEEQLLFRCRSKAIVHLTPDKESATDQDDDDKDDNDDKGAASKANKAPAGAKQKQKPAAPKNGAVKKGPSAKAAARAPTESGVTSIEKRPPKAKVDDAYKVPPPDPSVDPFSHQLGHPAKQ